MSETEEFGGLIYMNSTLDPTPHPTILSTGRFFPLALLTLPVFTLVLVFIAPVASAGASLAGSEVSWAALVSGGVASAYCVAYLVRQCRHSHMNLISEKSASSRLTQITAHILVATSTLGVLVTLALEPASSWALLAVRTMVSAQAVAMSASGLHQLYVAPRCVKAENLMMAYDSVMTTEQESVALDSGVWEQCAKARALVGLEKLQAERIHHLEAQKQELAAELVRLHAHFGSLESENTSESPETELMLQIDQQTSELRSLSASHKTISDQLEQTSAAKEESEQVIARYEKELDEERALNAKMGSTMAQMKELLRSTMESRNEVRDKYKLLKRSVSKMVGVPPELKVYSSPNLQSVKVEPQIFADRASLPTANMCRSDVEFV
jgi:hypothetical protein